MMSKESTPSHARFLAGTALGSLLGALFLVPFGPAVLGTVAPHWWGQFALAILLAPVMFVVMVVAGWPLFAALRSSSRFHLGLAAPIGAAVGASAGLVLRTDPVWAGIACFAAAGTLATSVCWWWVHRRGQRLKANGP